MYDIEKALEKRRQRYDELREAGAGAPKYGESFENYPMAELAADLMRDFDWIIREYEAVEESNKVLQKKNVALSKKVQTLTTKPRAGLLSWLGLAALLIMMVI